MGIWIDGRAVGQLSVSHGIPCRVGYRAAQDNVPSGMLRRTGYHAFVCFRSGRLLADILGDARVYFGRSEAVDAVIVAARSSGWVTLSSLTTMDSGGTPHPLCCPCGKRKAPSSTVLCGQRGTEGYHMVLRQTSGSRHAAIRPKVGIGRALGTPSPLGSCSRPTVPPILQLPMLRTQNHNAEERRFGAPQAVCTRSHHASSTRTSRYERKCSSSYGRSTRLRTAFNLYMRSTPSSSQSETPSSAPHPSSALIPRLPRRRREPSFVSHSRPALDWRTTATCSSCSPRLAPGLRADAAPRERPTRVGVIRRAPSRAVLAFPAVRKIGRDFRRCFWSRN